MEWLEHTGWQFGYQQLTRYNQQQIPLQMQVSYSYTSNISLPTELAKQHLFLEDVNCYGWEDMEWGKRLKDSGVRIWYEARAVGHHHHKITETESLNRMVKIGRSLPRILQLNPSLDRRPMWLRIVYNYLRGLVPTRAGRHRRAYARGLLQGIKITKLPNYQITK